MARLRLSCECAMAVLESLRPLVAPVRWWSLGHRRECLHTVAALQRGKAHIRLCSCLDLLRFLCWGTKATPSKQCGNPVYPLLAIALSSSSCPRVQRRIRGFAGRMTSRGLGYSLVSCCRVAKVCPHRDLQSRGHWVMSRRRPKAVGHPVSSRSCCL